MERFKKFAAPALAALIIFLAMFLLKSVPASKLWKGYTTLSVPANIDSSLVEKILSEENCAGFISLQGQPKDFSGDYEQRKSLYFFDKEKEFKLYYIPDNLTKEAGRAAQRLQSDYKINAFMGSQAVFSRLPFLVCLIAFALFFFYSENRLVFLAAAFPGLFYAFCNPYYGSAASVCLEFYAFFLGQRLWRRKGALQVLTSNFYILLFCAAAFLLSMSAGFKRSVLFMLNLICAFSLLLLFFNLQIHFEKKARFLPLYIRNAKRLGSMTRANLKKAFFVSAEIFLLFIFLCAGTNFLSSSGKKDLLFPAPKDYNGQAGDFPTLDDYFANKWNLLAAPYRSLNKKSGGIPNEGDTIEMTHYKKTGKGIESRREIIYTYDKAFEKEAADALEKSDFPYLEKVWKAQEKNFSVGYSAGASESAGAGLVAALLLGALLPFFAALRYILILRRGKYEA